jgi:AbiV family abortive infection protein
MKITMVNSPRPRRRRLAPAQCARFRLEAAENAAGIHESSHAAADLSHYGLAVALEVLALEEAAKAQVLGMMFMAFTFGLSPDYSEALLESVIEKKHTIRHWFASFQIFKQEIRHSADADPIHLFSFDPDLDSRIAGSTDWLGDAESLKQNGLYVDPRKGWTPSRLGRPDYDRAVAIVEPNVSLTLKQARTLVSSFRQPRVRRR